MMRTSSSEQFKRVPTLWDTPLWRRYREEAQLWVVNVDQLPLGHPTVKPTGGGTNMEGVCCLDGIKATDKPHPKLGRKPTHLQNDRRAVESSCQPRTCSLPQRLLDVRGWRRSWWKARPGRAPRLLCLDGGYFWALEDLWHGLASTWSEEGHEVHVCHQVEDSSRVPADSRMPGERFGRR